MLELHGLDCDYCGHKYDVSPDEYYKYLGKKCDCGFPIITKNEYKLYTHIHNNKHIKLCKSLYLLLLVVIEKQINKIKLKMKTK